ncbi:hypothetical protein T01_10676 [Trichinella spiralis]|uniref:Uncharacterized protein n=1 Tax=Trichinella spiralis TaxID=6334 RepID=A0A0V1AX77_TRISP|nr:hypothetical protein T01_10676 [Trichinella spiralis]
MSSALSSNRCSEIYLEYRRTKVLCCIRRLSALRSNFVEPPAESMSQHLDRPVGGSPLVRRSKSAKRTGTPVDFSGGTRLKVSARCAHNATELQHRERQRKCFITCTWIPWRHPAKHLMRQGRWLPNCRKKWSAQGMGCHWKTLRIYWDRERPPDLYPSENNSPRRLSESTASRVRPSVVRRRDLSLWYPSCFCSARVLRTPLQ